MFAACSDMQEAHRLSAVVFGMEKPLHLKGTGPRKTDSINSGVYEEEPAQVTVRPRVRYYKEKSSRSAITDHSEEKARLREAEVKRLAEEQKLLNSYIKDGKIEFAALPEIELHVRDVFLLWLSRALENKSGRAKTDDGRIFRLENPDTKERCHLRSPDGVFEMPAFTIRFEGYQTVSEEEHV